MRFSTAFEHMLNGKAIRRYHWKPESCLRLKRGKIYVCTSTEHKLLGSLNASAIMASDWQVLGEEIYAKKDGSIMQFFESLNTRV